MARFLSVILLNVFLEASAFGAGIIVAADGSVSFRKDLPARQAEFQLQNPRDPAAKLFDVKNVRGVLILNEYITDGGEGWRTTVPLGTIDSVTGKVELFAGIRVTSLGDKIRFMADGTTYPSVDPSLPNLAGKNYDRVEVLRRALSCALIQQTFSDRFTDLQGVSANFVDRYLDWRPQLDSAERAQFDLVVLKGLAADGFSAMYRNRRPIQSSGIKLLKLGLETPLSEKLTVQEKSAAEKFLGELIDPTKGDFLDQSRTKELVQKEAAAIEKLRASYGSGEACNGLNSKYGSYR